MQVTRAEAAALVRRQLSSEHEKVPDDQFSCWHYGKVELRELLDAIYGPPTNKDEEI